MTRDQQYFWGSMIVIAGAAYVTWKLLNATSTPVTVSKAITRATELPSIYSLVSGTQPMTYKYVSAKGPISYTDYPLWDKVGSAGYGPGSSAFPRYRMPIYAASIKYNVPVHILAGQLEYESRFGPWAISTSGACGIAQFKPIAAKEVGLRYETVSVFRPGHTAPTTLPRTLDPALDERFDPTKAILAQAKYMRRLKDWSYTASWEDAIEAYNVGMGNFKKAVKGEVDGKRNPTYVSQVMTRAERLKKEYNLS